MGGRWSHNSDRTVETRSEPLIAREKKKREKGGARSKNRGEKDRVDPQGTHHGQACEKEGGARVGAGCINRANST